MLRLFRLAPHTLDGAAVASVHRDEDLLDIRFQFSDPTLALAARRLTKFRRRRKSGAIVSLELRGGIVCGLEMLGIVSGRWDSVVDTFSEEIDMVQELPLLGIELDGQNTKAELGVMTIDQAGEFFVRFAERSKTLEVSFDEIYSGSCFGAATVLFNKQQQVSGIRIAGVDLPG